MKDLTLHYLCLRQYIQMMKRAHTYELLARRKFEHVTLLNGASLFHNVLASAVTRRNYDMSNNVGWIENTFNAMISPNGYIMKRFYEDNFKKGEGYNVLFHANNAFNMKGLEKTHDFSRRMIQHSPYPRKHEIQE